MPKDPLEPIEFFDGIFLSPREIRVLWLASQGLSAKQIADQVELATDTVYKMLGRQDPIRSIYMRIGARNRGHATAMLSEWSASRRLLDLLDAQVRRIYETRIEADPRRSIEWSDLLVLILGDLAEIPPFSRFERHVGRLRARALMERFFGYSEFASDEVILGVSHAVTQELREVAVAVQDPEVGAWADLCFGSTSYMLGEYEDGLVALTRAEEDLVGVDELLSLHRHLALCWAFTENQDDAKRRSMIEGSEADARALIGEGRSSSPERDIETLEGIGRSHGRMDPERGLRMLEEARGLYEIFKSDNEHATERSFIQCARSEIIIVGSTDPGQARSIEERGKEALSLANLKGLDRYEEKLEVLLTRFLN